MYFIQMIQKLISNIMFFERILNLIWIVFKHDLNSKFGNRPSFFGREIMMKSKPMEQKVGLSSSSVFKGLILVTLTFSTSLTILMMRVSRKATEGNPEKAYLPSTVVFITECVKFVLSMATLFYFDG